MSEAEAVERHLAGCPRCRREVAELREVAARFAGGPAPARVWDGIATEVVGAPEVAADPELPEAAAAVRKAVSLRVFTAVVALAALVSVALGVQIGRTGGPAERPGAGRPGRLGAGHRQPRRQVVDAPLAGWVPLRHGGGAGRRHVVPRAEQPSRPLRPAQLPALGQVGANMVSLAVMRTPAAYQQFSTPAETMALVITDEPATGVISTTKPPVVSTPLPAATGPRSRP